MPNISGYKKGNFYAQRTNAKRDDQTAGYQFPFEFSEDKRITTTRYIDASAITKFLGDRNDVTAGQFPHASWGRKPNLNVDLHLGSLSGVLEWARTLAEAILKPIEDLGEKVIREIVEAMKYYVAEFYNGAGRSALAWMVNHTVIPIGNWMLSGIRALIDGITDLMNRGMAMTAGMYNAVLDLIIGLREKFLGVWEWFKDIQSEIRKLTDKIDTLTFYISKTPLGKLFNIKSSIEDESATPEATDVF